jgi:hypothetical protein
VYKNQFKGIKKANSNRKRKADFYKYKHVEYPPPTAAPDPVKKELPVRAFEGDKKK